MNWNWVDTSDETFSTALNEIIKTKKNLCIMGPGGSGKSVLLRMTADLLPGNTIVLSSTGISAANLDISGQTLHSFFHLKPIAIFDRPSIKKELISLFTKIDTIVIDEISMVSAALFDQIILILETYRHFMSNPIPRLILFGDVLQLPPVINNNEDVKRYYELKYHNKYYFFNAQKFSELNFNVINLNTIYRQKDKSFQEILNRIRFGQPTSKDLAIINKQVVAEKKFVKEHNEFMYLTSTNNRANAINAFYYEDTDKDERVYQAEIQGEINNQLNVPSTVELSIGMQVMCTKNYSGFQNGTLGKIVRLYPNSVDIETHGKIVNVPYLEWKNYKYTYDAELDTVKSTAIGSIKQIACKPALACTIHKAQGLTLDAVYVDISHYFCPIGAVYLALSRTRELRNIGLKRKIDEDMIRIDPVAIEFVKG